VGIPLLAAFTVGAAGGMATTQQRAIVRITALLLPFPLFSLAYVMDRWQSGLSAGRSVDPLRAATGTQSRGQRRHCC
jgi:hypothetical protein